MHTERKAKRREKKGRQGRCIGCPSPRYRMSPFRIMRHIVAALSASRTCTGTSTVLVPYLCRTLRCDFLISVEAMGVRGVDKSRNGESFCGACRITQGFVSHFRTRIEDPRRSRICEDRGSAPSSPQFIRPRNLVRNPPKRHSFDERSQTADMHGPKRRVRDALNTAGGGGRGAREEGLS